MQSSSLFYLFILILIFNFISDKVLHTLNEGYFDKKIPEKLNDIYDQDTYKKSQAYKKMSAKLSNVSSLISTILILFFLLIDGFTYLDNFARSISEQPILITLIFFGIIMIGSEIISTPISYYNTFVIEEKFGFNKTTKQIFWVDKIKGLLMNILVGGAILSLISWFYLLTENNLWIYSWILVTAFSLFLNMFYAKLIVPLFNKQTPLENGALKSAIE